MAWFNPAWSYRRAVTVDNTGQGAKTDYQVKVALSSANFDFANADSDGIDIRFTDSDETTELDFWRQDYDSTGETGTFWVKVPSIGTSTQTIYIYYGNAAAADASSIGDAFIFGDDFSNVETIRGDPDDATVGMRLGNRAGYSNNSPMIDNGGAGSWIEAEVREQSNAEWIGASLKLLITGEDASGNCDVGAYTLDINETTHAITVTPDAGNPLIPLAEDPYIAINMSGEAYQDGSSYYYVYFERKSAADDQSQEDIGVARTLDMSDFEVWDGSSWNSDTSTHVSVLSRGTAGAWDDSFTGSPTVVHDGTQFVIVYEGSADGSTFATGVARGANPQGTFTKEATNPISAMEVPDDLVLVGSTWILMGHGTSAGPVRYSTTDAPADWDSASFTEFEPSPTHTEVASSGHMSVALPDGTRGRRFTYQPSSGAQFDLFDNLVGGPKWSVKFLQSSGSTVPAAYGTRQVGLNTSNELVMNPDQNGSIAYAVTLQSNVTPITSDFRMMFRRKQVAITDDQLSHVCFGSGTFAAGGGLVHFCSYNNGYQLATLNPGVAGALAIREYGGGTLTGTVATGDLSAALANNFNIHEFYYLADGSMAYIVAGSTIASGTDATHVAGSKGITLVQADNPLSSPRRGGITTYDWFAVRKYDGEEPSQTVGTEEENTAVGVGHRVIGGWGGRVIGA